VREILVYVPVGSLRATADHSSAIGGVRGAGHLAPLILQVFFDHEQSDHVSLVVGLRLEPHPELARVG